MGKSCRDVLMGMDETAINDRWLVAKRGISMIFFFIKT